MDLSADNYIGIVESYVYLTKFKDCPGLTLEWVREDARAIQDNGGVFPSPPGIYYIDMIEEEQFMVDRLLDRQREPVTMSDNQTGMLVYPPVAGTLRLFEMPAGFQLIEGQHYTLTPNSEGNPSGEIQLSNPLTNGRFLSADYRYVGPTTGPHVMHPNFANNEVIPGVVLAFGNRNKKGDRQAVVVQAYRQPAALEYGGRWDISLDIEVMAQDIDAQEEIHDASVIYCWGILKSYLSSEGIEMTSLELGGESEEVRDSTGDDYSFQANFSMTLQTDWSIHVPLALYLRQVSPLTREKAIRLASLPDDRLHEVGSNIAVIEAMGLEAMTDPFFIGRNSTFEMIK